MGNGYLTGCALGIAVLLCIIFYAKGSVDNIETKIFKYMLLLNILESIVTTSIVAVALTINSTLLLTILNRMDVIILTLWCSFFFYYIYNVTNKKNPKKVVKGIAIIDTIICLLALVLDVNIINQDGILNSNGPLTTLGLVGAAFYIALMLITVFMKKKKASSEMQIKYIPLYLLIFMTILIAVLRIVIPEINFISIMISFISLIMMFTIENPDVKMNEQLVLAKLQAEKANHAKTDFLSNMSHEIRTPLNAIVGFSQILAEDKEIPPSAKSQVKDILMASESLLDIVNGVLDISKIEANKLEIVNNEYDLHKILDELVVLTKARIGEKPIELQTHFDPMIPPVLYGDQTRLKQIILNLLTNAAKYTKEGCIEFTVNTVNKEGVCRLIISVADTGIGIKKENIDKLFTKFERFEIEKSSSIEGTGLGLAITKRLVELMNGKIVVQSVYGKGSRFTVAIDQKIVAKERLEEPVPKKKAQNLNGQGKKVLVVDDNPLNLKVASRLLKNYNLQVETVESGQECIDKIIAGEKYDLILMDDMMPRLSGVNTLKKLKEIPTYTIPTVALTANALSGMREKYLADGFDDYLAKPINKKELEDVISKYLVI